MNAADLRNAILSRSKPVVRKVGTVDGHDVFVKVATVEERKELLRLGGVKADAKGEAQVEEPDRFTALCIVKLAVDEQGVRVLNDTDVGALMALNVDDAFWALMGPAAMAALNPDKKQLEESRGN